MNSAKLSMDVELSRIVERHPLPPCVRTFETFSSPVDIDGLQVQVVGLSVSLDRGLVLTGAAADVSRAPYDRSYFELLERIAIAEAGLESVATTLTQRMSSSSGVALHVGGDEAKRRARLELIERDRVLRSWYGGARPQIIERARSWPLSIERHYRVTAYRFEAWSDERGSAEVVGVVAFPRSDQAALSMGFAARESLQDALDAAGRELLQQVAFGWGEPVPDELPEPAATPEFHLDFYGCAEHHRLLQAWLDGAHEGEGPELPPVAGSFQFSDITPAWLNGDLRVVRAKHPAAVPLAFGVGHPWFPGLPEKMRVQPIA